MEITCVIAGQRVVLNIVSNDQNWNKYKDDIMVLVEHSKCKMCQKVQHICYLKENENGVGKVCIDVEACKKRQDEYLKKSQRAHEVE